MAKICVFCSSSDNLSEDYIAVARETGRILGERKHHLIYGGSHRGLMGELSKSFAEHNGKITEIIPKMWEDLIVKRENAIVTKDLAERLQLMQENSEGFVTLAGGFGSLQELIEVIISKQLKMHQKPLAIVNTKEFYTPIINQIKNIIDRGFAPKDNNGLLYVANTPSEALDYIENYSPVHISDKL
jgi:cytokinin riboside 5'-monophosphate phosphoribohydrolase